MKVTGTATLHAPAERVWQALNDPAVLARTIPGCAQLEEVGPDRYRMTVSAGVASVKGTYQGDVRLTDRRPPGSFVLRASGAGGPGTVSADIAVTLADQGDGTTTLTYHADAVVGGMIGGVGQRVLSGVARRTAAEFFQAVDDVLTGAAAPEAAPTAAGAGPVFAGARPVSAAGSPDFVRGAVFGAAVALLGVLVGAALRGKAPARRPI